ncbi:MAG: hypothetical protein II472_05160, partial [Lachnospiraceae bacterium]|nr:hypothetical protein [Lachnospiraceae bacterium]
MHIDQIKLADYIKTDDDKKAGMYGAAAAIIPDDINSKNNQVGVSTSISAPKTIGKGLATSVYNKNSLKSDTVADDIENDIEHNSKGMDMHNKMAVYANTVSEEDFAKMQEDGFNPMEMEVHDIVTVADKIKVALAKGGHDVSMMGGISDAALQEMTGSVVEANRLENVMTSGGDDGIKQNNSQTDSNEMIKKAM